MIFVFKLYYILITLFLITVTIAHETLIYWNTWSEPCLEKGYNLPVENYGVVINKNKTFIGDKVSLLYEKHIGLYPFLKKEENGTYTFVNGGLPQNVVMKDHLLKLEESINATIPDPLYKGLAIIDVEEWRPLYQTNWGGKTIYRDESIKLVKQKYPSLSDEDAVKLAKINFDESAFTFLNKTLEKVKQLRPYATWGFYDYPLCLDGAKSRNWEFCFPDYNDKIVELLKHVDAIYASPYLYRVGPDYHYERKDSYVRSSLEEAYRIRDIIERKGFGRKKIFVFQKFEIDSYIKDISDIEYYDPYMLCITYQRPVDYKVDGILIWSSSINMAKRCSSIQKYIEKVFGPFIRKITQKYKRSNMHDLLYSKKQGAFDRDVIELTNCRKLVTDENLDKWCKTGFYGPECMKWKHFNAQKKCHKC
uniref:Hyaluronidase n=1 Tax=Parastrongyloides trichosuri TaxID=131310 RepID=A0A0N4ZDJ2_PARTI